MDELEKTAAGFFAVCAAVVIFFAIESCNEWLDGAISEAHGSTGEQQVVTAIQKLQPAFSPPEAAAWAGVFSRAGKMTSLDPLLLVVIGFRESSLREDPDPQNETPDIGTMQLRGIALKHVPRGCDPRTLHCNVEGGAAFLQYCKAHCTLVAERRGRPAPSWWVWVAAYGMDHCPTEQEARQDPGAKNAYRYYLKVGGTDWVE